MVIGEGRPSRAAKDLALANKPWVEGHSSQPAAAQQQPPKQGRITDTFPVRKGPAAPHKALKSTAVAEAPKPTATERTKARAARTSAATQAGASRSRKRRNAPRNVTDEGNDDSENDMVDNDEAQVQEVTEAVGAVSLRRSGRKSAAAPARPPAAAAPPSCAAGGSKSAGSNPNQAASAVAAPKRRGASARATAPRFLNSWEIEGEEYRTGDDVYVVETDDFDLLPDDSDNEECCVCSRATNPTRMVECDRCLRGFHFRCLKPPLKTLPEGDWMCPDCEKGAMPSSVNQKLNTSCQAFLFGDRVLGLARITGWMRDRQGEVHVLVRHYKKPEETHLGRQPHNHSREVFLGVTEHQEPVGCIWGRAYVVPPARFGSTPGTDVYICEYEYDDKWKRFRRCLSDGEDGMAAAAASDDDEEWGAATATGPGSGRRAGGAAAAASSSDDGSDYADEEEEERDVEYKPRNTLDGWVIRKPRPGQQLPTRNGGRGRGNAYRAILDESGTGLLLDQGATVVPDRGPVGQLAAARRALALNNCANGLPCRDNEKQVLRRFIGQTVEEGGDSPGVLYICGVPGTGKTACVMEVLGGVRAAAQSSGLQLVILNALQLPSPQHVYSKLWERMSGQRWGPARALKALEECFSGGGRRHMTLLIVDEIDVLITKDQAVLYNLFEWPLREGARLAVIGISNTHDLDSRVLPRIASRLSGSKLAFNPYNHDQLKEILNTRLQGVTAVAKGAVEFCARKVASTTGDVRRALELLRRATEIAETQLIHKQQQQPGAPATSDLTNAVATHQVVAAIREMYGNVHMTLLRTAGLYQKLVLVALLVEMRAQNKPEVTVAALHHRLTTHLRLLMDAAALPLARVVEAAAALGAQRLVLADAGWLGPGMRLTLNIPQDDLVTVLREDPALRSIQSCLA